MKKRRVKILSRSGSRRETGESRPQPGQHEGAKKEARKSGKFSGSEVMAVKLQNGNLPFVKLERVDVTGLTRVPLEGNATPPLKRAAFTTPDKLSSLVKSLDKVAQMKKKVESASVSDGSIDEYKSVEYLPHKEVEEDSSSSTIIRSHTGSEANNSHHHQSNVQGDQFEETYGSKKSPEKLDVDHEFANSSDEKELQFRKSAQEHQYLLPMEFGNDPKHNRNPLPSSRSSSFPVFVHLPMQDHRVLERVHDLSHHFNHGGLPPHPPNLFFSVNGQLTAVPSLQELQALARLHPETPSISSLSESEESENELDPDNTSEEEVDEVTLEKTPPRRKSILDEQVELEEGKSENGALESTCEGHTCPNCARRFQYRCRLMRHMIVHMDVTRRLPFTCKHCPRRFRFEVSMVNHLHQCTAADRKTRMGEKDVPKK